MSNCLGNSDSEFMTHYKLGFISSMGQKRFQKGAGFVEVLVALFILAIGLLGVLSMQSTGLGSNQRALFSSEVNILAFDMADRIRSFGVEGVTVAAGEYAGTTSNAVFAADPVVNADQAAWQVAFAASSLPSADGAVLWNPAQGTYTITIRWDAERSGVVNRVCPSNARDAQFLLINLTCYQLTVTP